MKNYLLILLVGMVAFGLSACPKGTVSDKPAAGISSGDKKIGYDVSAAKAKLPAPKTVAPNGGDVPPPPPPPDTDQQHPD